MGTHPIFESDFDCLTDQLMSNLYFSPESLRSPFKDRRNQEDTPITNRYSNALRVGLVAKNLKKMSDSDSEKFAITSTLDDTRDQSLLDEEEALLADSPSESDVKTEIKQEEDDSSQMSTTEDST